MLKEHCNNCGSEITDVIGRLHIPEGICFIDTMKNKSNPKDVSMLKNTHFCDVDCLSATIRKELKSRSEQDRNN